MSITQIFALVFATVVLLGAVGILALTYQSERGGPARGLLDRRARRADRSQRTPMLPAPEVTPAEVEAIPSAPLPPPKSIEVGEDELGVTRRQFLNRGITASFGVFLAGFGTTALAFMWPKLSGGFGTKIDAGELEEIKAQINLADGTVRPFYVAAARSYVLPFSEAESVGTDFEDTRVIAGDLTALYQKCVHLGCKVPWCASSQGFECPCHGSKYNLHGEYAAGPAPRNLDRFEVSINELNHLIIDTGKRRDTPRAEKKSVIYPQGPSCL